jgi:L-lactate dehydrogenase complex protein LldF
VCPVKVDLDVQLYKWRQQVVAAGHVSASKGWVMRRLGDVLGDPALLQLAGAMARAALRVLPNGLARRLAGAWGATRELPQAPPGSFRAWRRAHRPELSPRA